MRDDDEILEAYDRELGPEPGTGAGHELGPEPGTGAGHELGPEPGTGAGHELGPEPGTGAGHELGPEAGSEPRRAGRGFWIVLATIVAASAILVVEIFANRPIADTFGRAQHDLRVAEQAARSAATVTGSFEEAGAAMLDDAGLDGGALSVVGPDEASARLGEVSVYADATTWAAAVSVRPNGCFYLKVVVGRDDPLYGSGTDCTGRAALDSRDPRW